MISNNPDKKTEVIFFRLSYNEKVTIYEKMMAERSDNLSAFLLSAALNRSPTIEIKNQNTIALINQFKYFNNNFNQAVKALNTIAKSADKGAYDLTLLENHLAVCVIAVEQIRDASK